MGDIDLTMVDKVQNVLEVSLTDSPQVDERIVVLTVTQDISKEWAAGTQYDFVSLNFIELSTDKSDVKQIFGLPKIPE